MEFKFSKKPSEKGILKDLKKLKKLSKNDKKTIKRLMLFRIHEFNDFNIPKINKYSFSKEIFIEKIITKEKNNWKFI